LSLFIIFFKTGAIALNYYAILFYLNFFAARYCKNERRKLKTKNPGNRWYCRDWAFI